MRLILFPFLHCWIIVHQGLLDPLVSGSTGYPNWTMDFKPPKTSIEQFGQVRTVNPHLKKCTYPACAKRNPETNYGSDHGIQALGGCSVADGAGVQRSSRVIKNRCEC